MGINDTCFFIEDNTTAFTFFSEFGPLWPGQTVVEVLVLSCVLVTAVFGNGMVLVAIVRNPRMRTSINYVIGSMAVSDVMMAAGIPVIVVTRFTRRWVLGQGPCKAVVYAQFVCGIASILSLTLVSLERYLHVAMATRGRAISLRTTLKLLAGCWVLAFLFPVPVALAQGVKTLRCQGDDYEYCGVTWPDHFREDLYMGSLIGLFFVVPLAVMCVCYLRIVLVVRASSSRVKDEGGGGGGGGCCEGSSRTSGLQLRLVKMSACIVTGFVFMWLPFFILSFLGVHNSSSITSSEFTPTLILAFCNSALNPLLYGYFNTTYRREFKAAWVACCPARSRGSVPGEDAEGTTGKQGKLAGPEEQAAPSRQRAAETASSTLHV